MNFTNFQPAYLWKKVENIVLNCFGVSFRKAGGQEKSVLDLKMI